MKGSDPDPVHPLARLVRGEPIPRRLQAEREPLPARRRQRMASIAVAPVPDFATPQPDSCEGTA